MNTPPNASPFEARQQRLSDLIAGSDLQAFVVNAGPTLGYLTGLDFHLMERPVVLMVRPGSTPVLVLPQLETAKLDGVTYAIESFTYDEDPAAWHRAFAAATAAAGLASLHVGVEPRRLRFLELQYLQEAAPDAAFVSGDAVVARLRVHKDRHELSLMRKAVDIAQRGVAETLGMIKPGVTEKDVAAELILQMTRAGADAELPFAPIIAFGAETANPHAGPRDYALHEGELILIDWGAGYDGYFSDLTRMYAFGDPGAELKKITQIVLEANAAGRDKAGPGIPAAEVDRAARSIIEKAGYGDRFVHRTGHGIGLETHEDPYIRGDNEQILEPGMCFTIEPGIYLRGKGGARIEDDVVVTENGADVLSDLSRELMILQ